MRSVVHEDLRRVPVSYKLPRWLVEWLRTQDTNATQLVEVAVIAHYKLAPPIVIDQMYAEATTPTILTEKIMKVRHDVDTKLLKDMDPDLANMIKKLVEVEVAKLLKDKKG